MRPDVPRTLDGVAENLLSVVLPEVESQHGRQVASLAARLASMAGQEFNRAAARLVEENQAVLVLLEHYSDIASAPLQSAIAELASKGINADLHIPALQDENDKARALLIRLHAEVETLAGTRASEANEAIWEELRASTRRRHLNSGLA